VHGVGDLLLQYLSIYADKTTETGLKLNRRKAKFLIYYCLSFILLLRVKE